MLRNWIYKQISPLIDAAITERLLDFEQVVNRPDEVPAFGLEVDRVLESDLSPQSYAQTDRL